MVDVDPGIGRLITKQSTRSIDDDPRFFHDIANEIIPRGENLSKRWREQLARQSSFVGRSTPREQDSWRNSCNWLHFGSETTKEVSSCTSNGVTVVLKILVSHLSHWIPPRTERKRVFSSAARAI